MKLEACRRVEAKYRLFRLRESDVVSSNRLKGWQTKPDLVIRIVRERTRFQAQLQKMSSRPSLRVGAPAPQSYPLEHLARGIDSLRVQFPDR